MSDQHQYRTISSCSNDLIKAVCSLHQTQKRTKEQAFIFEGSKLFEEACQWGVPLTHVFFTERWLSHARDKQIEYLNQAEGQHFCVSDPVMDKLSGQSHGEGIFCRAKKKDKERFVVPSIVLLENVQDPGNVGTIIRAADAAGFKGVITTPGTADIYSEKVLRASMGSVFHLPVMEHADLLLWIDFLKQKGYTLVGSALEGSEVAFIDLPSVSNPVLILGNESKGMSIELKQKCDILVRIPMRGHAESLNVSTAAGLLLYKTAGLL